MSDIRKGTVGSECYTPHPWIDEDKRRLEQCPWCEIERLRREQAEARKLLKMAALALDYCQMMLDQYVASGQYTDDRPLIARIDAFLAGEKP